MKGCQVCMELYKEIIRRSIVLPEIHVDKILESKCYQALCEIQRIIRDDRLSDKECFMKIEQIICVFEDLGSDGGTRHDFG